MANKSQKRSNIGVVWPLEFFIVFMLRNSKKIFQGQIQRLFSFTANQSTWGDHYLYYVIFFSMADVNARKNYPWINFGVSVDSWRQVKLWFVCIVVFYGFFLSVLCINKPARSVAQNNSKAKYGQTHYFECKW